MSKPRFLLDEHVWAGLAKLSSQLGTSVINLQQIANKGIPDDEVLKLASKEERTLLTANTCDFAPLAAEWFLTERTHWGIVIVPGQTQHKLLIEGITNMVQTESAESLKNTLRFIQEFIDTSE